LGNHQTDPLGSRQMRQGIISSLLNLPRKNEMDFDIPGSFMTATPTKPLSEANGWAMVAKKNCPVRAPRRSLRPFFRCVNL
jgi:hypothetical protein